MSLDQKLDMEDMEERELCLKLIDDFEEKPPEYLTNMIAIICTFVEHVARAYGVNEVQLITTIKALITAMNKQREENADSELQ